MFKIGDRVEHPTFGKGRIIALEYDVATVVFDSVGTKNITLSFLSQSKSYDDRRPTNTNDEEKQIISDVELLAFLIYVFEEKNVTNMTFSEVKDEVFKEYGFSAFSLDDIKRIVEPHNGIVFYNTIVLKHNKINKTGNNIYRKNTFLSPDEFFINKCSIVRNEDLSYVDVIISRFLIKNISDLENAPHSRIIIDVKKLIKFIANSLMFVKAFPPNGAKLVVKEITSILDFDLIKVASYLSNKNEGQYEYAEFFKYISAYIRKYKISGFWICDTFFDYQEENNIVVVGLPLVKEIYNNSRDYENKCLESMVALIEGSKEIKAIFRAELKKKTDEKLFTNRFEYDDELNNLQEEIDFDVCTKNHFKELMKKHNIPTINRFFDHCLKKLGFKHKDNIIFPEKYKTLKDYYIKKILSEEVHHYSNPMAIDEYDRVLRKLEKRLEIIEFEKGLFITKTKLEKSGINKAAIEAFHRKIHGVASMFEYFSFKHIYQNLQNDPIVEFCYTDELLLKFISPMKDITIIEAEGNGVIFTLDNTGKAKGNFLKFVLDDSDSMTVTEIEDYVDITFGVKYTLDQIKKAVVETDLYFSEEMETVYKNKGIFLEEVFDYGS